MDLARMLMDALVDSSSPTPEPNNIRLPHGYFDLTAAAETFLAKVREANQAEAVSNGEGLLPSYTMD